MNFCEKFVVREREYDSMVHTAINLLSLHVCIRGHGFLTPFHTDTRVAKFDPKVGSRRTTKNLVVLVIILVLVFIIICMWYSNKSLGPIPTWSQTLGPKTSPPHLQHLPSLMKPGELSCLTKIKPKFI